MLVSQTQWLLYIGCQRRCWGKKKETHIAAWALLNKATSCRQEEPGQKTCIRFQASWNHISSNQYPPSCKCCPLRLFHFTLQLLLTKSYYSLPDQICRWGNPPMCLCQVFVQFLSLNSQVIQATLKSIYNKSSFGWQGFASTLWAFLIPMGLNWKKTHNLRRNKFRDCFWVAERAGSILGVTQWEICLWDSGEE